MRAHDIALKAHELALKAAAMEDLHEEALKENEEREKVKRHRKTFAAVLPILNKWFPGIEWEFTMAGDYGHDTIITEKGALWSDSLKIKADRFLIDMNDPNAGYKVHLRCVEQVPDTSMPGYSYWTGPEVKSAADVGRWLAQREK